MTNRGRWSWRALDRLVPAVLLHVSDFYPSGESIFTAMTQDAAAFVVPDRAIETLSIEPVRVALTAEQIEADQLPTAPPKASDRRSASGKGETCQFEALASDQLAAIVRPAIASRIDMAIFASLVAQEREERVELLALPTGRQA